MLYTVIVITEKIVYHARKKGAEMRNIMGINVGMLIFGLIDGTLAYAVVFHLIKARFKGGKFGRILGTILGTIVFANYIALFVWFNTPGVFVNPDFRNIIYAAPIVLSVLLTVLVLLSQPPKKLNGEEETEEAADEEHDTEKRSTTPDDLTAAEENS